VGDGYFWDRQRVLARVRSVCRALFRAFLWVECVPVVVPISFAS